MRSFSPLRDRVARRVRDIPDFPTPGILFKDITPVLADGELFGAIIDEFAEAYRGRGIDLVAGIESRGFILAAPVAARIEAGFIPIRKPGKLPYRTARIDYALEYGTDALEAHVDAAMAGDRVLILDDVLATGGTAAAAVALLRGLGATVDEAAFLIELQFLDGRSRLSDVAVTSLLTVASPD